MTRAEAGDGSVAVVPAGPGSKGARTKERLLRAAEQVFGELGYHDASVAKITELAEVAQGTFYRYFEGKQAVFEELVADLSRRVRHAMSVASGQGRTRLEAERLGFQAFFHFTAEHPALYRVIRQAEFASPRMLHWHYEHIADGYAEALRRASAQHEIAEVDPEVTAWALMAVGEMIGMRWILWDEARAVPPEILDQTMAFVTRALGIPAGPERGRGEGDG